ncbi:uncharacterized protein LOC127749433 [Frankliniella occidentalis]|uniref:Uncharacterized protein LOC127749433 n=1 Tax=Frankliniella occidentalis TaxID=133901 RepID=A0A9C6TZV1_FRAOC|nr:uncharacterized protein LOC127749433 [Frankliniella occidentalis]
MALRPASPPPPPPLPPTHRPDLFSVERCLHDALERGLSGLGPEDDSCDSSRTQAEYNDAWTADACRILAAFITRATAKLDLKRYKTACVVRIIEKRQQRFCSHFAALWNSDCDGYCSVIHETDTLVAHALLMLVYWD